MSIALVYFVASDDADVLASARQALSAEQRDGTEKLVYITTDDAPTRRRPVAGRSASGGRRTRTG